MIKEITDIATECFVGFQVINNEYEDGETKTYQFNWRTFLTLDALLVHARHYRDMHHKDQTIADLKMIETKLNEKVEIWKQKCIMQKKEIVDLSQDCNDRDGEILRLVASVAKERLKIKSLRSRLGVKTRKLNRLLK